MVDPNVPSTLFYASRTAGLWKSTNSGLDGSQIASLFPHVMRGVGMNSANGGSPVGIEFVVFDTTVPTTGFTPTGTPTQTDMAWDSPAFIVGVGTFGTSKGAYTTDAGISWTQFPGGQRLRR